MVDISTVDSRICGEAIASTCCKCSRSSVRRLPWVNSVANLAPRFCFSDSKAIDWGDREKCPAEWILKEERDNDEECHEA